MDCDDPTEKLIRLIRDNYPSLYDTKNRDYTKANKKKESFIEIAKILNYASGAAVKNEWTTLRNRHREALRRQRHKRTFDASYRIKPWQYQELMSFLLPFMKNSHNDTDIATTWDDDYETQQLYKRLKQEGSPYMEDTDEPQDMEDFDVDKDDFNEVDTSSKRPKAGVKRNASEEDVSDPLRKPDEVADGTKHSSQGALYYFFMSMYKETKKMPTNVQCRVKRKIFDIINREEEKLLDKSARECADSDTTSEKHSNSSSPSSFPDDPRG